MHENENQIQDDGYGGRGRIGGRECKPVTTLRIFLELSSGIMQFITPFHMPRLLLSPPMTVAGGLPSPTTEVAPPVCSRAAPAGSPSPEAHPTAFIEV